MPKMVGKKFNRFLVVVETLGLARKGLFLPCNAGQVSVLTNLEDAMTDINNPILRPVGILTYLFIHEQYDEEGREPGSPHGIAIALKAIEENIPCILLHSGPWSESLEMITKDRGISEVYWDMPFDREEFESAAGRWQKIFEKMDILLTCPGEV